jgi:hypothetical protein
VTHQELPESIFGENDFPIDSNVPQRGSQTPNKSPNESFSPTKASVQPTGLSSSSKVAVQPEPIPDISSIFGSAPQDFLTTLPSKSPIILPKTEPLNPGPTDFFDHLQQEPISAPTNSTQTTQKPKVEVLESSSLFSTISSNFL